VLLVHQAALLDGLPLDAFTVEQDGLAAAEVDIGRVLSILCLTATMDYLRARDL
jgi:hypothetical protein